MGAVCTSTLGFAAAALVIAGIAACDTYSVLRVRRGDASARLRAFFTLPTKTSRDNGQVDISVDRAGFAAFIAGTRLAAKQGKVLVIAITVTNHGRPLGSGRGGHFADVAPSGRRYVPVGLGPDPWSALPAGTPVAGDLTFDVPRTLGAAKLVYDDGCTRQEWVVPLSQGCHSCGVR